MKWRYSKYTLKRGLELVKTKTALTITTASLVVGGATGLSVVLIGNSNADSNSINFEAPAYTTGSINGQHGWSALGSAGHGCAT